MRRNVGRLGISKRRNRKEDEGKLKAKRKKGVKRRNREFSKAAKK